ncbi:MAG: hypothetical protein J0H71_01065 [Rhizobiales bacterium]|nr:hypothetical protein [Hyphomicrobiales bacterium]
MMIGLLIAIAAGCASALMFASISSGALISLLLFYLAPLPLMLAAIGWGPAGAAIGGVLAGGTLGLIFSLPYLVAFLLAVALPAWWLGRLVLLGRPVAGGAAAGAAAPIDAVEWYPVGRLLLWIAGFAALTTMSALFTLGTDSETIAAGLRHGLGRILQMPSAPTESTQIIDALAAIAPAAATIIAMTTLTLNVWLAAYVTSASGRLRRPWPALRDVNMPPMTLVALFVALAMCFTGGLVALLAQIATAALMLGYALTGFAVLHTITLGIKSRGVLLSFAYALVLVFGWPVIAMIALGIIDAFFGIRQRYLQRRPPPLSPT